MQEDSCHHCGERLHPHIGNVFAFVGAAGGSFSTIAMDSNFVNIGSAVFWGRLTAHGFDTSYGGALLQVLTLDEIYH